MKNRREFLQKQVTVYAKKPVTICITVNVIVILLVFALRSNLPPVIPLFYGKPEGEDQLASTTLLILPALLALSFVVVNFMLEKLVNDSFLSRVLIGLMIGCSVLSTITIVKIMLLVGNF